VDKDELLRWAEVFVGLTRKWYQSNRIKEPKDEHIGSVQIYKIKMKKISQSYLYVYAIPVIGTEADFVFAKNGGKMFGYVEGLEI